MTDPNPDEARLERSEVQRELDEQLRDALLPVTGALVALYAFFVVADYYTMPAPYDRITASLCLGLAFVFLLVHVGLRLWSVRLSQVHAVATLLALLILANSLVPLAGLRDPVQTTYLMLLELGCGVFFLRWSALAVVLVATDLSWLAIAATTTRDFAWDTFGFALLSATLLAVLAHGVRIRVFRRLSQALLTERDQRRRLEAAVEAAREIQQRYRSLAEATSEGVVVVDDLSVVDANPGFARRFGRSMEDVIGRRLGEFFDPATVAQLEQSRFAGTTEPFAGLTVHTDGPQPVQLTVKLTPHGGRFLRIIAVRDL